MGMKRILAAVLLLTLAAPAWAEHQAWGENDPTVMSLGKDAYSRGDYAGALHEWRSVAKYGGVESAEAQFLIAGMYFDGKGLPRDLATAFQWYRKAAEQGHAEAQFRLGNLYHRGLDEPAMVSWYRRRAEQGYADAQFFLGLMSEIGQGLPQDEWINKVEEEAVKWYRKAAEQGHADAQYRLGNAYHYSVRGVPKDDAEAAKWFRKAAEQGQVQAQLTLANWIYRCGGDISWRCRFTRANPDYTEAAKWYRLAAEQGNAEAQRSIGVMYAEGQGIPQDYVLAHKWLNLAAAQGGTTRDTAVKIRDLVASKMTPEQIAEAWRLTREWMAAFEKRKQK